jgi:hypothetical protein
VELGVVEAAVSRICRQPAAEAGMASPSHRQISQADEPHATAVVLGDPAALVLLVSVVVCSEHGLICHLFELILVIHANTSNGTNHIV